MPRQMGVTRRDLDRNIEMVRRAAARTERIQRQQSSLMDSLTQTAEVGAGALAGGFLAGRYPEVENRLPVPTSLLLGLGLKVLGYAGLAGRYDDHLQNFGDGFLASYISSWATGFGAARRVATPVVKTQGVGNWPAAFPVYNPAVAAAMPAAAYAPPVAAPLTEAELQAMAMQWRPGF